jgi:hypothetical protein
MSYVVMYLVLFIWRTTANILRNPLDDDSMVDAWARQQTRVKQALAKTKSKHAPAKPADSDDEWVGSWIRQQTRLREAIAHAKRENQVAKSHEA